MDSKIMDVLGDRVLELGPAPDPSGAYRHFKLTRDAEGIAWLLFDRADASANTLSAVVLEEFDQVLNALEAQRPTGIVIRSAKPSGFIAGADVNEFRGASDPLEVETQDGNAKLIDDIGIDIAECILVGDLLAASTVDMAAAVTRNEWARARKFHRTSGPGPIADRIG